jgi:dienelactone hydrolase
MKRTFLLLAASSLALRLPAAEARAPNPAEAPSRGDQMLAEYFRSETASLARCCLADIKSLDDWKAKRGEYRRQLQEMLGLWPMPERTDLKPVITGRLEHDEFTVEKLHFQASPRLYVSANLYLPKGLTNRAPAILYVCGHGRVVTNGVSLGNKTSYQHHGEWFARNGYVCLTIDTLQLGEIQGLHHGTYREGQWWWNARGYTPAGVEAWFGLRALDYLCSRPEVDAARIGMTGRSGGGAYSWTVAALDERVKVAAPVAGITDMQNHVVDGCIEGHCDCMFFVNRYRWDFPQVAALIAPRPLLLGNTDKDRIFPLDGVVRLHDKVQRIYRLYGETNKLGLLITDGPHADTQDLQVPVFRWFNRWLKGEEPLIEKAAKKLFQPAELKVFGALPADELNTKIQETFVPAAKPPPAPLTAAEWEQQQASWLAALKQQSFAGWPGEDAPPDARPAISAERGGMRLRAWDIVSQHDVQLRFYLLEHRANPAVSVVLEVLDDAAWKRWLGAMRAEYGSELSEELAGRSDPASDPVGFAAMQQALAAGRASLAWFAPRGAGSGAWSGDEKKQTQLRRRFMLLGQTLDGMRVWDVRCAVRGLRSVPEFQSAPLTIRASGTMGVNALYAALFEPGVARLELSALPKSHRDGPDYLNVLKILDLPQALQLAAGRCELRIQPPP